MSGHGGARKGAGRPATPVNKRRVFALREQGLSVKAISESLNVSAMVVRRVLRQGLPV
jgi:hypothetical protein